jgi:hypothetical protein
VRLALQLLFYCSIAVSSSLGQFFGYLAKDKVEPPASAPSDRLSVLAFPDQIVVPNIPTPLFKVFVTNRTAAPVSLPSCDSLLYLVEEAKDSNGKWKPIESTPVSWCGNSYYNVTLPSGSAWSLMGRTYSGSFKTRMRFRLITDHRSRQPSVTPLSPSVHSSGPVYVYSNEFDGSIDPEQFKLPKSPFEVRDKSPQKMSPLLEELLKK